jgi:hypothetical protein
MGATAMNVIKTALACLMLGSSAIPGAALATTTTFSAGDEGWTGNADIDTSLGTPAPAFHSLLETFGLSWRNESNPAFVGDYTAASSVTISLDVLTNSIAYLGTEVTRGLFVKLTDIGNPDDFADNATVYYKLGTLSSEISGWQHLSVTIDDTSALGLPSGWGGVDGDGNLSLPAGRSFADVLAHVGQIEFTSYEPDYFYGFTDFDVAGDNFTVTPGAAAVPEPMTWAMMMLGMGAIGAAMRQRRSLTPAFALAR